MESIEKAIEIDLPLRTVYDQWTQFEEFPKFMSGVTEVTQLDDKRLHWKANIAGRTEEWDAEITEQLPDAKIAWRSTTGAKNAGSVEFDKIADGRTRVRLTIFYVPEGFAEHVGDALGVVSARVSGDLQRFKEFIENRGLATGAWRGEIHHGDVALEGDDGPDVGGVMLHGSTPAGAAPVRRGADEDEIAPEP